jgi:hypothetical protein
VKEADLRQHATCTACRKPVLHTGVPLFWRVTIERFGVDTRAAVRQDSLAAFIGSTRIASVMGPDEDMATPMMEPVTITLCETCACSWRTPPIAALVERVELAT